MKDFERGEAPLGHRRAGKSMAMATTCHGITYTKQACGNSMPTICVYMTWRLIVKLLRMPGYPWHVTGMNGARAMHS